MGTFLRCENCCCLTCIGFYQSIKQSNVYSANIPGGARLSDSQIGVPQQYRWSSSIISTDHRCASVYEGMAKSKTCVSRCFLKVATNWPNEQTVEGCSKETGHKSESSYSCVGLDPRDRQTDSFFGFSERDGSNAASTWHIGLLCLWGNSNAASTWHIGLLCLWGNSNAASTWHIGLLCLMSFVQMIWCENLYDKTISQVRAFRKWGNGCWPGWRLGAGKENLSGTTSWITSMKFYIISVLWYSIDAIP